MSRADRYRKDDPDRKFLQSREWRERIRPRQMRREPLCRFCAALGYIEAAEQVDHIKRPRGDWNLQRYAGNLQSLCANHHGTKSAWERTNERNGTDSPLILGRTRDGWSQITAPGGTLEITDPLSVQPMGFCNHHKP